jgi:hypothetical protein
MLQFKQKYIVVDETGREYVELRCSYFNMREDAGTVRIYIDEIDRITVDYAVNHNIIIRMRDGVYKGMSGPLAAKLFDFVATEYNQLVSLAPGSVEEEIIRLNSVIDKLTAHVQALMIIVGAMKKDYDGEFP